MALNLSGRERVRLARAPSTVNETSEVVGGASIDVMSNSPITKLNIQFKIHILKIP
jgi:hypothetical protein